MNKQENKKYANRTKKISMHRINEYKKQQENR